MANELKAKDRVKWSHNGGYVFGTVINVVTSELTVGSEKISASDKAPYAQVELPTGQTSYVSAGLCTVVSATDYGSAISDIIASLIKHNGDTLGGWEYGCEAYKNDLKASKDVEAKFKKDFEEASAALTKAKKDYEDMCAAKSELEAQLAAAKVAKDTMASEYAAFKSDTVAKERVGQLKTLNAVAYLDKDESKVFGLVKVMSESEFSNIVKVVTAAQTNLPKSTDQTVTNLPKSTDQTQTNLTKLTQAEVETAVAEAKTEDDKSLASVTSSTVDKNKPFQDFFRANLKFANKKSEKSSK